MRVILALGQSGISNFALYVIIIIIIIIITIIIIIKVLVNVASFVWTSVAKLKGDSVFLLIWVNVARRVKNSLFWLVCLANLNRNGVFLLVNLA